MPVRIIACYRLVMAISILIQAQRIAILTGSGILCQESCSSRIIVPALQIIQSAFGILIITGITVRVGNRFLLRDGITKGIIVVFVLNSSCLVKNSATTRVDWGLSPIRSVRCKANTMIFFRGQKSHCPLIDDADCYTLLTLASLPYRIFLKREEKYRFLKSLK